MSIEKFKVKGCVYTFKDIANNDCYITCTEWMNGEGYDIEIQSESETKRMSLHYDELNAIKAVTGIIETSSDSDF